MSQVADLLTAADAIEAHLSGLPALDGVSIIVNRQKDLDTEISTAVAKAGGAALLIEPVSGRNSEGSSTLQFEVSYSISLWSLPLLRDGDDYTASQRVIAIMSRIQHFQPAQKPFSTHRLEITEWQIQPDETFLIYNITATLTEVYKADT